MQKKYSFRELSLAVQYRVIHNLSRIVLDDLTQKVTQKIKKEANNELENLGYFGASLRIYNLDESPPDARVRGSIEGRSLVKIARRLLSPKEAKYIRWAMVANIENGGVTIYLNGNGCESMQFTHRRKNINRVLDKLVGYVDSEIKSIISGYTEKLEDALLSRTYSKRVSVMEYCEENNLEFTVDGKKYDPELNNVGWMRYDGDARVDLMRAAENAWRRHNR